MEKTFNKIVLSSSEPNVEDLWMRINIERLPEGKAIHGHSLWWFTPQGWKKLFDFDTRYDVSTDYSYSASDSPYDSKSEYNPKVGIVSVGNIYYLYDASRKLGNNANFVTEKGLKYHVDDLQKQINVLDTRLTAAESNIRELRKDLNEEINTRTEEFSNLETRLGTAEQAINTTTSLLDTINSSLRILDERISNLEANVE